mmetsp:Transcript_10821/g.23002  ORF Transcript_10821/g.23002 Transcript_10821/m.23002 type:complete len:267 (+) Transcript_10821:965-1765(+)
MYPAPTSSFAVAPSSKDAFVTKTAESPLRDPSAMIPSGKPAFPILSAKVPFAIAASIALMAAFGSTLELGVAETVSSASKHFLFDRDATQSPSTASTPKVTPSLMRLASSKISSIATSNAASTTAPAVCLLNAAFVMVFAEGIPVPPGNVMIALDKSDSSSTFLAKIPPEIASLTFSIATSVSTGESGVDLVMVDVTSKHFSSECPGSQSTSTAFTSTETSSASISAFLRTELITSLYAPSTSSTPVGDPAEVFGSTVAVEWVLED